MSKPWHQMGADEVSAALGSDAAAGLSEMECRRRLDEFGPNLLAGAPRVPWWRILLAQFQDFMVVVLLVATAISYGMGETADAITIVVIVILNAVLGFVQEFRAERSLEALKDLTAPTARVRRGGQEMTVAARDLVPGDLVLLEAGDRIPADARLVEATGLEVEESALTGESLPVRKSAAWTGGPDAPLGDRRNMLYMGTTATRGRGTAIVVATGMQTEMGRIANLIQEVGEEETPLQKRLAQLGKWLVAACLAVCAIVVLAGLLREEALTRSGLSQLFLAGVSLAVAAIPEGLPAIVTVALALGVQRMIRRNAIVRKLQAVETLGCATVICSDKTGTLTKNEMMVRAAWAGGRRYVVTGDGYRPAGEFLRGDVPVSAQEEPDLAQALKSAALCSNARLVQVAPSRRSRRKGGRGGPGAAGMLSRPVAGAAAKGEYAIQGDPTEGALVVAAQKGGYRLAVLHDRCPRLLEVPFESERRRMSVLTADEAGGVTVHVKGAPDVILELSTHILRDGRIVPLTDEDRQAILDENQRMADEALRVLAVAFRPRPLAKGAGAPATGTGAPGASAPATGTGAPAMGASAPATGTGAPGMGASAPATGTGAPAMGASAPATGAVAPAKGAKAPAKEAGLPARREDPIALGQGFEDLRELTTDQASALLERDLVFLGLFGMIDPPRPEVKKAVAEASRAGIRTVMITGDHPATALAVARELGIVGPNGQALTGRDLDRMTDSQLIEAVQECRVFARVSPQHKLQIVRALKALGEVVAMTGDGVNDAPAVKEADIGIAMGRTGTDVTKEASAMILADDNYATIVAAVEEGRGIYDNIRKFIRYLLSCNTGEVLTMFLAAIMRMPLPLLPIQILFVNLVTDGLPAMALGVDPTDPDVMRRPPRRPDEGVFARRLGIKVLGRGVLIGLGTLTAFLIAFFALPGTPGVAPYDDPAILGPARTMALATLVCAQLIHVFDCRSERRAIWETPLSSNPWLVAAVASSVTALLLAVYWPPLAKVFGTAPLQLWQWLVVLLLASAGEVIVAVRRLILFGRPLRARVHIEEEA
ncbi:Ca2+-transporting ATPase [Symbiobacterium terraclitae]|uniref:Ca2+-transporting ATPase n=1 Tax=Symbiobacterium terraclitae TaxID=557451 RepID=A0ABS4JX24_9FIRM|nr:HAD-IC family P-type ATPase [Symbiobacterium terraclitae]MBP2020087.1 Ca2+-transporting ATPase [Symbiobacterium terraclitae]